MNFFTQNNLLSSNQSCFNLGDSHINQLLSITHDVYNKSFDEDFELRSLFLHISKVFDNVCNAGLFI